MHIYIYIFIICKSTISQLAFQDQREITLLAAELSLNF